MPTNPSLAATGSDPTLSDIRWHDFDLNDEATWPPYGSLVLARGPAGGCFVGYFHHDWGYFEFCDEWRRECPRVSSMEDYGWRNLVAYAVIEPSVLIGNDPHEQKD